MGLIIQQRRTAREPTKRLEPIQEVAEERKHREQLHAVLTGLIKQPSALLIWQTQVVITHITNIRQEVEYIS